MGFLVALVVVAVVVVVGGVAGLVGALGGSGAPVLLSAGGATEAAGKVNIKVTVMIRCQISVYLQCHICAGDAYLSHISSCQVPWSCCQDRHR